MSEKKLCVGFIGIGAMGAPISENILKAGFPLTVYNRNAAKTEIFAARGVPIASSCADIARKSDVVITMIGQVSEELEAVLGAGGVLEGSHPGMILVDMSTIGIVATKKLAAAAQEKGVGFLDATVSGSIKQAKEASLHLMVGGDHSALNTVRPVLEAVSEKIHHAGPNGAGSAMKMIVNLMVGMTVLAVAEAMTLGSKAGLDPFQMLEILGESAVRSPHLFNKGMMMLKEQFEPSFALKYMQKDFDLIMEAAQELKTPLFISAMARKVYMAANVTGYGDFDYAAVVKFLQNQAELTHDFKKPSYEGG